MSDLKKITKNISIAIIPFIFLISIGLIRGEITYHQKIFKTLMILVFNLALLSIFTIHIFGSKDGLEKKKKYLLYFIAYFLFIFFQFVISFLSKEISYDREYYLANYTFLIIFSMFFYLYINNLEEVKVGLLIISIFFVIVMIWSLNDFIKAGGILSKFRPKLSFGNTNYFAGYAIGLFPLALITSIVWYNTKKKLYKNWVSIITFIVVLLGVIPIFFSQTRAALFGLYIGLFVVLIPSFVLMINKLTWKVKIPIAFLLIILFLVCPVLALKYPPPIVEKLLGRLVATMSNPVYFINDRLNGWKGGMGLFFAHPIFGAGLGTVYPASFKFIGKYFYMYSSSNSFKHSHNEYVEVLGEAGAVGIIVFFALFGFVIVSLLKRTYSKKYQFHYRAISLAVSAGLISMLIQQVFSLTLRMSVTMTAYFFLIGLGIFLISYSKKALISVDNDDNKTKKSLLPKHLDNNLSTKQTYSLLAIIALFILISLFLFLPVFRSENNIIKAFRSKSALRKNHYFKKAVKIKPDNPYAWTQKWQFDLNGLNSILSNYGRRCYMDEVNEKYFDNVKQVLDKLNSIIPGYQDVWSKYANYYAIRYDYFNKRWRIRHDIKDMNESKECLKKILKYVDISLNMNFLNVNNHLQKMLILSEFDNKNQHIEAVKDYFIAKIHLDYAKKERIVKEKINIEFGYNTDMEIQDNIHCFTISIHDVESVSDKCFSISGLFNYKRLEKVINKEIGDILNSLNSDT